MFHEHVLCCRMICRKHGRQNGLAATESASFLLIRGCNGDVLAGIKGGTPAHYPLGITSASSPHLA